MTKWTILGVMALGILAAGSFYTASADDTNNGAPAFKPASPLHSLMELNGDEFKALRKAMKPKPNFKKVRQNAYIIAEIGNVASYHKGVDEADWWKYGQGLKEAALAAAQAADDKDAETLETAVQNIGANCKACHDQFKK